MAKLAKVVWTGIVLIGVFELGRLSKLADKVEEEIINKMSEIVAEYKNVKEVKND